MHLSFPNNSLWSITNFNFLSPDYDLSLIVLSSFGSKYKEDINTSFSLRFINRRGIPRADSVLKYTCKSLFDPTLILTTLVFSLHDVDKISNDSV